MFNGVMMYYHGLSGTYFSDQWFIFNLVSFKFGWDPSGLGWVGEMEKLITDTFIFAQHHA